MNAFRFLRRPSDSRSLSDDDREWATQLRARSEPARLQGHVMKNTTKDTRSPLKDKPLRLPGRSLEKERNDLVMDKFCLRL